MDSSNLHHLVAARLAKRIDGQNDEESQNDEEIWSAIFPEPVENVAASKYILNRSLPRPRDVLSLCQKAIDHAQRNGHTHVTTQDILDGEKSFSEALFYSVSSEFKGLYPDLEEVLIEFAGVAEKILWSDFEGIADSAIQNNMAKLVKWVDEERHHSSLLGRGAIQNWTNWPISRMDKPCPFLQRKIVFGNVGTGIFESRCSYSPSIRPISGNLRGGLASSATNLKAAQKS